MKKYSAVNTTLLWKDILPHIQNDTVVLLNTSENEFLLAWGNIDSLIVPVRKFDKKKLSAFIEKHKGDYVLGYFSYDIKNDETRRIRKTVNHRNHNDLHLIVPEHVLISKNENFIYFGEFAENQINDLLKSFDFPAPVKALSQKIKLKETVSKTDYLKAVNDIRQKIQNGEIYEMNYCVNFTGEFKQFNPYLTYQELFSNAGAPFSAYVQFGKDVIISASPERYLKRSNNFLTSQPIKGTAKRGVTPVDDKRIAATLSNDVKELAENIMIVDLVRNDLSRIAEKDSVFVSELCEIYSFETVHQLISSVQCSLKEGVDFADILQASFPMGSMTGAPKVSAIKNIDHFETFNRGIYSGTIGYIDPNGNFDFNVIIRTIIADMDKNSVSTSVGGAITIKSDPEQEYKECLLKLRAIEKTLC